MENEHSKKQSKKEKKVRKSKERHIRPSGTPHPQEVDRAPQGSILVRAGSGWRGCSGKGIGNLN